MKEVVCYEIGNERLWVEGSETLIDAHPDTFWKLFKLVQNSRDAVYVYHTHPQGNVKPSNTDIESLTGLAFATGKVLYVIILTDTEFSEVVIHPKALDGNYPVLNVGHFKHRLMFDFKLTTILEAIKRSEY